MKIPVRMVNTSVSELSRLQREEKKQNNFKENNLLKFCFSYHPCYQKIFKYFLIILLIVFVIEVIMALWIWQMPTDKFQRFVSCLDIGTAPSWKECIAYYIACFLGTFGG